MDPNCCWCGDYLTFEQATIEHLKPRSAGGTNAPQNLRIACGPCNSLRGSNSDPEVVVALSRKWKSRRGLQAGPAPEAIAEPVFVPDPEVDRQRAEAESLAPC